MEKHYNNQTAEAQAQQLWESEKTYTLPTSEAPLYSIDTPPPTVSGSLHIGHVFSYTQTDIIARYKRLQGFRVFYPFGFDDNGLSTERYVEKKRGVSAYKLGRSEFIKVCLQETQEAEKEFITLWQRLGLSVDWNMCYSTISEMSRKISQESFIILCRKGFIYRKNEPALYCTACRTSVAQAELDDAQKPSTFSDLVFKDNHGHDLIIATTRPELLPSVVAVLYHPNDIRYQYLEGRKAFVPLFGQEVPILPDETVVKEKGTGLVMVSTFGDKTDVFWFKKHNLPYRPMIDFGGIFIEQAGILAGLTVLQARAKVLEELQKAELIREQKPIMHSVNVHERCKREIEYLMLPQWFLNILEHKKALLAAADSIAWYPSYMKTRYTNWVENLSWDWGLSRQRFYGIPFPAWHCKACGEIILAEVHQLPIDPQEVPYPGGTCPRCKSTDIVPDTDVMDTWNTSSLTPYLSYALFDHSGNDVFENALQSNFLPMSMRPQAHDIIRTWAFYTITKTWMHHGIIPWGSIVISGHVLSSEKEKLSKSKGNATLTPQSLIDQFSADAIRYWTASGALGTDVAFSEAQIKIGQRLITKLFNAFRFISEHTADVDMKKAPQSFGTINEWVLDNATQTFERYKTEFERNEFSLALDWIEKFFWQTFCDNYIELVKDQLFNPDKYDASLVAATRWTLYHVGLRILQWYAPFIPYITEHLYQELYKNKIGISSLHITNFADTQTSYLYPSSAQTMHSLVTIIAQVRRLKTERQLSLKTPLKTLNICLASEKLGIELAEHEQLLRGVCQAESILFTTQSHPIALEQDGDIWHTYVTLE